jgi:methyl acetate hydrolase
MTRVTAFIFAFAAAVFAAGGQATQSVPASASSAAHSVPRAGSGNTASVDAVLADAVARGVIPGVVAMVTDRERVLYQGAFGVADASNRRPLRMDAMFRIASMTKPVTTVAAMQLLEQGRFSLDDPAGKYLPELAGLSVFESFDGRTGAYTVRPVKKAVTIRHLLTHTSGLGYYFTSATVRDFKPRDGEQYSAGPLLFEPGERWIYGTGLDWVGRLVESLSGNTLEEYFRQHIFGPLEMSDTSYNVPDQKQARLVTVHRRRGDASFDVDPNQPPVAVTRFVGGGGLSSTATDYVHFLQMLLNRGTWRGTRILAAGSVAQMSTNQIGSVSVPALKTAVPERSSDFTFVADGRDKWGLGFLITTDQVPGKRSPGSLSWGGINNTYFWVDPTRGIAGVILMQFLPFADSRALAVYDSFERAIYQLPIR